MPVVTPNKIRPSGLFQRNATGLLVRLFAGITLLLFHGWALVRTGFDRFWNQKDWVVEKILTDLGLPFPLVLATALAVVLFLGSLCLIIGLFGRFVTMILLATMVIILYFALQNGQIDLAEQAILYIGLYVAHIIEGSGAFALDSVLIQRRTRRKAGKGL